MVNKPRVDVGMPRGQGLYLRHELSNNLLPQKFDVCLRQYSRQGEEYVLTKPLFTCCAFDSKAMLNSSNVDVGWNQTLVEKNRKLRNEKCVSVL